MVDSKNRFSNRVENYVKYRPSYPEMAVDYLCEEAGLEVSDILADIGSGTGIFTRKLLERSYRVVAIEPNAEMRHAAEAMLSEYSNFTSVNGTAEATTLAEHSVSCIVSAQAFHWFELSKTKEEFNRILKPNGKVALIWNKRLSDTDAFAIEYEQLLKQSAVDYEIVDHRLLGEEQFASFFRDGQYMLRKFANEQHFDRSGFIGRVLSSSYTPPPGSIHHEAFIAKLGAIFEKHQHNGSVIFRYETEVYTGNL
ncbi:methyltransferase [Paenibacillus baekrokdamisoli]|uniref:Methyltransferase n=1 Tax=Paenibacillus baekrokdamisoli TaxID=1712516 RepID=A0A3G9J3R5_9BACL|nr:class I SAM-dependent methyltransferase [Paenibacillus baekrokdamisoli]MBB3067460.1 SAM-dependent methyltransferase [Paenibacillus baekrokdamisoli]BBH19353.1 methyltransferase [Paenibacillus baekrokdamisoli]